MICIMRFRFTFYLFLVWIACTAQTVSKIDSLKGELLTAKADTNLLHVLLELRSQYDLVNVDSSLHYSQQALELAQRIQFSKGQARALYAVGSAYRRMGEIPTGLDFIYKGFQIATDEQDSTGLSAGYSNIGLIHFDLDEYVTAISNFQAALKLNDNIHEKGQEVYLLMRIAYAYSKNKQSDSASAYMQKALNKWKALKLPDYFNGLFFELIGEIEFSLNNRSLAFDYLNKSIQINQKNNFLLTGAIAHIVIAGFYKESGQKDSAISYAKQGLVEAKLYGAKKRVLEASSLLAELYELNNLKEALYYRKVYDSANDELYGRRKVQALQKILSDEQGRQRENEIQKMAYKNRIRVYGLLLGLGAILIIAFILYRNNRLKQRANFVLQQQKEKVESTLQELKSAQAQLIQSEKMASLGELTAGIAHEIQNPLNFVNNFSEVNDELIHELKSELAKGNLQPANEIINNIRENELKINHHGKRADAIVKGMLQHSRSGSGQKEMADINALCDEYLRLAYHGQRAKDKSFNAKVETDFDSSLSAGETGFGKINIMPQDIGRVILNLINNAFYATSEQQKSGIENYEPVVRISTKKIHDKPGSYRVEIRINDNGNGISQKNLDKIFQPFFTTKPTGQGTGLGLSLAYDIVKAHGGEIKVVTTEGLGSTFTVTLQPAL